MAHHVHIKICGIRTPKIAEAAAEAGADAIGLVCIDGSPRFVTTDEAQAVADVIPPFVSIVGLFTLAPTSTQWFGACDLPLTVLQLHGAQKPEEIDDLAPLRVLRALPFNAETAAADLRYWDAAHQRVKNLTGLLLDSPDPRGVGGGTGQRFDWTALRQVLDEVAPSVPIVLAGGLTPDNVADAIRTVRPYGVDVSTGVESQRGVKDPARIRAFCQAVHQTE